MSSDSVKFNALVLAAGFGTRMRPVTNDIPKPLIKICNRPLLENILINLEESGVDQIALNTHYLPEKVDEFIAGSSFADKVSIFHEEEILGTGGPAINSKNVLEKHGLFLLHNGDILSDVDFADMVNFHANNNNIVTMLTLDGPENKLKVMEDGSIVDILGKVGDEHPGGTMVTYGGVMVMSSKVFDYMPEEPCNCSIIPPVIEAIKAHPGKVKSYSLGEAYWNDMGTIERFFQAHEDILVLKKCHLSRMPFIEHEHLVAAGADVDLDSVHGFVCADKGSFIGTDSHVEKCILLEGAKVNPGELHVDEIIGTDFSVHRDIAQLKQLEIIKDIDFDSCRISSLIEYGSARGFFRLQFDDCCRILMVSDETDEDFKRFVKIGSFLSKHEFATPKVYNCNLNEYSVLMEDLGNTLLYDFWRHNCNDEDKLFEKYADVVDALVEFQLKGTKKIFGSDSISVRTFEREYLRWETGYFKKQFLQRLCGFTEKQCIGIDAEFDALADAVFSHPKIFMHRDFQSQNIMLCDGRIRFVDFQGARIGPVGYDIMSLLRDPYVNIPSCLRKRLLERYFKQFYASPLNHYVSNAAEFKEYTVLAGLQRNMQALGAYGFLPLEKGKKQYLKYIPQALVYLREGLDELAELDCGVTMKVLGRIWEDIQTAVKKLELE